MIKVGITGGIGSGKTVVCEIFSKLGIKIYNADTQAKRIMNTNPLVKEQLTAFFGSELYKNNELDRPYLASLIFNNPTAIAHVNSVVHPAVKNDFNSWANNHLHETYIIKEAALFFESNTDKEMDIMVTVYAPENLRILRVQKRDSLSREQIISRMANQLPDEEKVKRSDWVIINNEQKSIIEQVLNIHNDLISRYR